MYDRVGWRVRGGEEASKQENIRATKDKEREQTKEMNNAKTKANEVTTQTKRTTTGDAAQHRSRRYTSSFRRGTERSRRTLRSTRKTERDEEVTAALRLHRWRK